MQSIGLDGQTTLARGAAAFYIYLPTFESQTAPVSYIIPEFMYLLFGTNPSKGALSHTANQEISRFVCKPNINYCLNRRILLESMPNQINPIYTTTICFCKIHVTFHNNIFQSVAILCLKFCMHFTSIADINIWPIHSI